MQSFNWRYGAVDNRNLEIHGRSLLAIACSLFLFFVVFCIYIRWLCRYRGAVVTVGSFGHGGGSGAGEETVILEPIGLDKITFESLPVSIHVMVDIGDEEAATQCSICLSGLEEGDKLKVIPVCKHGFHPECIDRWFKYHPTCPLCRVSLAAVVPATV